MKYKRRSLFKITFYGDWAWGYCDFREVRSHDGQFRQWRHLGFVTISW